MNKKSIIIVIALMTFALLGSVALQVYWISGAIRINEEQFDKSIFSAMQSVAKRMERDEAGDVSKLTDFILRNKKGEKLTEEDLFNAGLDVEQIERLDSIYKSSKVFFQEENKGDEKLFKDNRRRNVLENMLYEQLYFHRSLEDRLSVERLNEALKREFKNTGLEDIKYNYGVFSKQLDKMIIQNGHYLPEGAAPKDPIKSQAFDFLTNTKYKVDLFTSEDLDPPGSLSLYFPNRSGYVWSSVWVSLLSSVIFTAMTLFSFIYTIYTIFRQKKLGDIKTDFINNMTHEFKTPIATISLATDTILNPTILDNPDKVRRFAEIIKQENKRMNGQVEKVLQAAIVDREEYKLKMVDIDLHEVIEQAADNFAVQVESRDGVLSTDLQANEPLIQGDLTHISNIINNLMDNANKYSPEKPEIIVKTRTVSGGVEVSISDKGIGLSSASRKLIFDKFYRVSTGNLHDVKGFGLGLSYVKAMVTAHKGTIDVKSDLGKGSTFIVFLPFNNA